MTQKNSEAKRKYWASLSPEIKSHLMSVRAKKAWAKRDKTYAQNLARKMVEARANKIKTELSTA